MNPINEPDPPVRHLAAAMAKAFKQIDGAVENARNPHFKNNYADLGAVIDAIKPALVENDLWYSHRMHESEKGVTVETIVYHSSGESVSFGKLFMPASKADAQGFGSALTYARRYSLATAFGLRTFDDDAEAARAAHGRQPADSASPILVDLRSAAMEGTGALKTSFEKLKKANPDAFDAVWQQHGKALKAAAQSADSGPQQ